MKESIEELLKALKARFIDKDKSAESEEFSRDRLKQLQEKFKIVEFEDGVEAEPVDEEDRGLCFENARNRQSGVVRWCGNGDRFMEQKIRGHNELGGHGHLFEIDPLSNLPD
ncbi:MAG TPA: hypothetical protein PKC98_08885 [Candidatus Melainabacteria bacterium]|nr:hypothetical protein [Candidatus Melainabacteria bacterium]